MDRRRRHYPDSIGANPELVQHVFSMPQPDSAPLHDGIVLANGTYAAVELSAVNPGAIEDVPEDQRRTLADSLATDLGNNDFQRYLQTLREDAEISRRQLSEFDNLPPL